MLSEITEPVDVGDNDDFEEVYARARRAVTKTFPPGSIREGMEIPEPAPASWWRRLFSK